MDKVDNIIRERSMSPDAEGNKEQMKRTCPSYTKLQANENMYDQEARDRKT